MTLRAWEVSDGEWMVVCLHETRGKARRLVATEYVNPSDWLWLSCKRAPAFDDLAARAANPTLIEDTARYIERGCRVDCAGCEAPIEPEDEWVEYDGMAFCARCLSSPSLSGQLREAAHAR